METWAKALKLDQDEEGSEGGPMGMLAYQEIRQRTHSTDNIQYLLCYP
jgi:hypothetical protein